MRYLGIAAMKTESTAPDISGVAGLIYEVLWAKYLALYVGSTGLAQVIVLATFMGGLALGDPRRAVAACDEFLAPYSGGLKVVLIRSRLQHELPPL